MSTEQPELTRVDSAVAGLGTSPKDEKSPITKVENRRRSSVADGVFNIKDLGRVSRSTRSSEEN